MRFAGRRNCGRRKLKQKRRWETRPNRQADMNTSMTWWLAAREDAVRNLSRSPDADCSRVAHIMHARHLRAISSAVAHKAGTEKDQGWTQTRHPSIHVSNLLPPSLAALAHGRGNAHAHRSSPSPMPCHATGEMTAGAKITASQRTTADGIMTAALAGGSRGDS